MSEETAEKDGGDVNYQEQYEALKATHSALQESVSKYPYRVDGKDETVNLFGEDGKPSEEAQRLVSGGKHVSVRQAELNAEVKQKATEMFQARLKEQGLTLDGDKGKGKTDDGKVKEGPVNVAAILTAHPDLKQRMDDGDMTAQTEVMQLVSDAMDEQAKARKPVEIPAGMTKEDVHGMLLLRRAQEDPRFQTAAIALGGFEGTEKGAAKLLHRFNELSKNAEPGTKIDLFEDVVVPYLTTSGVEVKTTGKDDPPGKTAGDGDGKETPPPTGANGAGAGGGGTPAKTDAPVLKTKADVLAYLKKDKADRTKDEFDQSKFL